MTAICPFCKVTVLTGDAALPQMSARKLRVYKAVLGAGESGITPLELLVNMYDEEELPTPSGPAVLRVIIHNINKLISKYPYYQRIKNIRRGCYGLISIEGSHDQNRQDSKSDHIDTQAQQSTLDEYPSTSAQIESAKGEEDH